MQVLIIEDELLTAEELAATLQQLKEPMHVVKIIASIKEAVAFLKTDPKLDLIFCDIQLGDGHSFEIFKQVPAHWPVIFCTAYNQYALEAFNHHGVGYLLKPFSLKTIKAATDNFFQLRSKMQQVDTQTDSLLHALKTIQLAQNNPSSILINWKDKIIPVKLTEIALFTIDHKTTRLLTKENQTFNINQTLDELEMICGTSFYRANRQYLVNRDTIAEVTHYHARKLFLKLHIKGEFDITIAKAKVPEFLEWLKQ
ncbi:MAG: hypothetical protein RLY16_718 [Bacteroidota bacterium]|jgi:DNA-binding LytR/AlgR family response regulator